MNVEKPPESTEYAKGRRIAEHVADQIRNAIVRGELTHNHKLPAEAQLMELFSVSRPTLREAIRLLEGENLIEVSRGPRGGAKIKRFTPDRAARAIGETLQASRTTLQDVFAARLTIEPPAAGMAASCQPKEAASLLRRQIIAEYETLGQVPQMAYNMSEFHITLVEVSGNQTLALLGRALQQIVLTHMSLIGYRVGPQEDQQTLLTNQREALQAHERLAALIELGDANAAETHWRQHLERWIPQWLAPPLSDSVLDVLRPSDTALIWR
jgi:DNA-binding FadR family transcriptional regulator